MDNIIEVKNLSKSFAEIQAVNNISFAVKKGEIFGFLGPNGAGKTTTTRMLTGVFPPDSGRIIIAGYDLVKNNLEARMSYLFASENDDKKDLRGIDNGKRLSL